MSTVPKLSKKAAIMYSNPEDMLIRKILKRLQKGMAQCNLNNKKFGTSQDFCCSLQFFSIQTFVKLNLGNHWNVIYLVTSLT